MMIADDVGCGVGEWCLRCPHEVLYLRGVPVNVS